MMSNNPYAIADSELIDDVKEKISIKEIPIYENLNEKKEFPLFSVFLVVILSIITMGIYTLYWLNSRTKIINTLLPDNKIPTWLSISTIVFFTLYLLLFLVSSPSFLFFFLLYSMLYIFWIFSFRNRFNIIFNKNNIFLNGFLTFFISIYYFQYNINKINN